MTHHPKPLSDVEMRVLFDALSAEARSKNFSPFAWFTAGFALGQAEAARPLAEKWRSVDVAPVGKSVLVYGGDHYPLYCGRKRFGTLGETQQGTFGWRCDTSGKFADAKYWLPLPTVPIIQKEAA